MSIEIRRFDEAITDAALHEVHNAFDNVLIAEEDASFGKRRLEDTAARLSHSPDDHDVTRWWAFDGDELVGEVEAYRDIEDVANEHLAWINERVHPNHRRRGLGTTLLQLAAAEALEHGRRLLMMESNSQVPSGAAFLESIGAQAGLEERISQLSMAELDLDLMDEWIDHGRSQRDRFELFWLHGRWPKDMLDDVVDLAHVMNDAPMDDLEFNDQAFTRTHITSEEDEIFERDFSRITVAARQRSDGRMVGYTQLFINPSFPDLGQQGDTGVHEDARGNRLGKWLKAEVARYLVAEHPEITRIRTGNASSNEHMLAINEAMGFRPHHHTVVWQIDTGALLAR